MKNKNLIISVIVVVAIVGFLFFNHKGNNAPGRTSPTQENSSSSKLISIREITHGHGLAVDVADPNKVYIATHHGLLLLQNEKDLYQVGESKNDYMGFSPHPTNPKMFFASGHPSTGGNIGFQKSEDGGFTWKKISDGLNGPVDFHAMAVSPVNPDLTYGWYRGALQVSTNGGKNWETVTNTNFVIVAITADSEDENIVYAASPQGLFISENKGAAWNRMLEGFVSAIAVHPQDSQILISFSERQGLVRSSDGGKKWEKINEKFDGETPLYISFNKQNPETVYILTEKNSIYKSTDAGATWSKIR